jgi:hypothetical protein
MILGEMIRLVDISRIVDQHYNFLFIIIYIHLT